MNSAKFVLLSLLLFCHQTCSASRDAIAANESLSDGSLVISRGGRFALGFFSPGSSSYRYLGIWYHGIQEQSVVWVANRNDPISGTSGIFMGHGYCSLYLYSNSSSKLPLWSANVSAGSNGTCVAQLLDSGNLVLREGKSKTTTVWQSFDYPSDTLLPGMRVGLSRITGLSSFLTSWRSGDDPGTGNFSYQIKPSASSQLFMNHGINSYWRAPPWPWQSWEGNQELYNDSFVDNEDGIFVSIALVDSSVLMRVVVDPSGILMLMTHDESDGQWRVYYTTPKQKCDFYGSCGPNSKCDPSISFPFECTCLPGYEPKYPRKWHLRDGSGGCIRKRSESSSFCGDGDGFVRVAKVKLPDTSAAIWVDLGTRKLTCEGECRRNCLCSAYATIDTDEKGIGCLIWYGALMDIVYSQPRDYDLYVRVDALELADYLKESSGFLELKMKLHFSIIIPSIVSAWLVIFLSVYLWLKKRKKSRAKNRQIRNIFHHPSDDSNYLDDSLASKDTKRSTIYPELPFFSLNTIHKATDSFSLANKLGQGGFGLVYKGKLPNGQEVAVKRLSKNSNEGMEQYKNEVFLIAKLQHRNLVKLCGCCIEQDEQILIYEYLPHNSLDSLLFIDGSVRSVLDWGKRFNIIVGIARGILYLHQDSRFRIIHRDLKPSNILLDAELNPKISDFGMARILKGDQMERKTTRIGGTYGYMSPEYALFGRFSVKSDVFSFGVILLETVTGKKMNEFSLEDPSLSLIGYVWELWRADRISEVVDSSLSLSHRYLNEALRCIQIGLLCVEEIAAHRPDMLAVVLMLNSEATPVPSPKQPAFVCARPKVLLTKERTCSVNEMSYSGIFSR
ncbi:unnamed protein product [Linum trigynum]|uniref:Receptor-like serine/threonine-protein kinase n=1 Tax=Linum trigynum TaxID=586398 RepID=A0AAV2FH63_9ROSI